MIAGAQLLSTSASLLVARGVYFTCQWLTLVALARLTTPEDVGLYSLALAVTTPLFLLGGLNLRAVLPGLRPRAREKLHHDVRLHPIAQSHHMVRIESENPVEDPVGIAERKKGVRIRALSVRGTETRPFPFG